jgi:hypothetical protein
MENEKKEGKVLFPPDESTELRSLGPNIEAMDKSEGVGFGRFIPKE